DYLILSHGHHDHTGGLATFAKINTKAKIFLSAEIRNSLFFSLRHKRKKDISPDHALLKTLSERLIWIHYNTPITDNVSIVNHIPIIYPVPKGNKKLLRAVDGNEEPDYFNHEIALTVRQPEGLVVFSGCSHKGLLNILHACSQEFEHIPVLACIGGTHLLDSDADEAYETDLEIAQIGKSILQNYPQMQLITGHCTGSLAKKILADTLGENFQTFYTGYSVKI
ncbi:MAG: MBL fold metallo-hydrolase, partial [Bacteroidales bacterium]